MQMDFVGSLICQFNFLPFTVVVANTTKLVRVLCVTYLFISFLFEIWKRFKYNLVITIGKEMLDIILKNLTAYFASARTWTGDPSHQRQTSYQLVFRTKYPTGVKFKFQDNQYLSTVRSIKKNRFIGMQLTTVVVKLTLFRVK